MTGLYTFVNMMTAEQACQLGRMAAISDLIAVGKGHLLNGRLA